MSNPTNITYGPYSFRDNGGPIPFLTITKTYNRSDDGTKIGSKYNVTIDGTLTPLPSGAYGYQVLDSMQDLLISGFDTDGLNFVVSCNGATLISEYPRINSIRLDKSNNNWVQTTPYTIELEWDGAAISGNVYVDNIQESWNMEFDDNSSIYNWTLPGSTGDANALLARLTHSVAAKGIPHYSGGSLTRPAWEHARLFVVSRLGYDSSMVAQTGVINLNVSNFSGYNHVRNVQTDELGGTYSVTESWLVANFGTGGNAGNAIEDFTVSTKQSLDDGLVYVDVNGQIQGVEIRNYGTTSGSFTIVQNKYNAASGFWDNVRPKLLGRAKLATSLISTQQVNPLELSATVGLNPTKGVINYGYSYNTRACNFISGSLVENITVNDTYPNDVFARVQVLGRGAGPILQSLNTVTESSRNVNIEVVMQPMTGCADATLLVTSKPTTQVNSLLCSLQSQLESGSVQLYKTQDSDSWNPKQGRYQRSVTWTWVSCTGAVSTDFCS